MKVKFILGCLLFFLGLGVEAQVHHLENDKRTLAMPLSSVDLGSLICFPYSYLTTTDIGLEEAKALLEKYYIVAKEEDGSLSALSREYMEYGYGDTPLGLKRQDAVIMSGIFKNGKIRSMAYLFKYESLKSAKKAFKECRRDIKKQGIKIENVDDNEFFSDFVDGQGKEYDINAEVTEYLGRGILAIEVLFGN